MTNHRRYQNCKEIYEYMDMVRNPDPEYPVCKWQVLFADLVDRAFAKNDIYVDLDQVNNYMGMQKYFPYDLFPWEKILIVLHDCTYYKKTGRPRWKDLITYVGRGAGKDGLIAFEGLCLASPYNPIRNYDVDICANVEDQALRPVKDLVTFFNDYNRMDVNKTLTYYFKWLTESITCKNDHSRILGHTKAPDSKDGLRSGIVIFNEVHAYKDSKNINTFSTGLGKVKHPRRSFYSTNGNVPEGYLDKLVDKCKNILEGSNDDDTVLPFLCMIESEEDIDDPVCWHKANPSLRYMPDLLDEMMTEYKEYKEDPSQLPDFVTKRMNWRKSNTELPVADWEDIMATNREMPNLAGWPCVAGIDYAKTTDWVAVTLHFRKGNFRYDIGHAWICGRNRKLEFLSCPWKEWNSQGRVTVVDAPDIPPECVTNYLQEMKSLYRIKFVALDDYRYQLMKSALKKIGFSYEKKNIKLIRKSDKIKLYPLVDSCFVNHYFIWGDSPVLRWATNNTKIVRCKKSVLTDDNFMGNYDFGKIDPEKRKNDPFMALVHAMCCEDKIGSLGGGDIIKKINRRVVKYN